MSLSRREYLEYCQVCTKKSFNPQKGIVCSLTGEHAAYEEEECPDFDLNQSAQDDREYRQKIREEEDQQLATFGLSRFGITNPIVAGIILFITALGWLVIGYYNGWIFFYPILLLIASIAILIRGLQQRTENRKKKDTNQYGVIDNEME